MQEFEYAVIGNGLMGSAAARYLSQWSSGVAIVGPGEPADQRTHTGVFSSHYDQGRLTRELSRDPIWAVISRRAVAAYPELQEKSGIRFHGPVGRVLANRPTAAEQAELLAWMNETRAALGAQHRYFAPGDRSWKEQFPFLDFPADYDLYYEPAPAGYVNPRDMLAAQNAVARHNGAQVIAEVVTEVESRADGVHVRTAAGRQLRAQKALVACGAFTNFHNLLPQPLPLILKTEAMIWATVSPETAARLQTMPGVGYNIADPDIDDIYMAPPLLYPDSTYKIKMGCNTKGELWPQTLAEVQAWFQSGPSNADLPAMSAALRTVLPSVEFLEISSHRCIVTYTPSGYPTIDRAPGDAHGRLFVATGGNGSGAGGADALGHAAAGLIFDGSWPDDLPRQPFLAANQWGVGKKNPSKAQARALELIRG
ncbi:MAG: FAD-dependent oxidoreductase [Caldilineaceae bacterium]